MMEEVLVGDKEKGYKNKASTCQTILNTFKLFLGISILASPHAFMNSGIVGGIIGISLATCLSIGTVLMQSDAAEKTGSIINSYSDLGYALYRGRGKLIVDTFILFAQLGICTAYLIFNGRQIEQIVCLETQGEICGHKNVYIFLATLILSPICWIKHLKNLSWIAFIALAGMLMALAVILYYDIYYITIETVEEEEEIEATIKIFDIVHYPLFFGIAVLNFEGNPATLNVQASMKNPRRFSFVFFLSAISVSTLVIIVSSLSYIAYGDEVEDLITLNLPHNDLTTIVRLVYSFGLLASFPLQMFPCLDIVEGFRCYKSLPNLPNFPVAKFLVTRTCIVIFCGIIAASIPQFGLFLDFIGAFSGTVLCFILPIVFYNKAFADEITRSRLVFNYFLLSIGTLLGGISAVVSFIEIISALV
ncbi:unnamed protein product [Moneuplotes crassus]|uniref:Amino acid transporter transmembrane domain-containing protein n=1 Tax=Euplotes crassus TaxID=5936 RepID=A0AAD1XFW6_EUPCR|nr:unnamed protein product [Moneuplotes crassus]